MKRTEETTAKHLSFSSSSLHSLQRKAFVLPSCLGRWRGLSFALLLTVSLTLSISVKAQNNNSSTNGTAISTKSGDNKEKSNKYSMPSIYKDKLSNFLQEEKNLFFYTRINDVPASKYTVDFVLKEMDSDWGITKDNQLLFIWHCVYGVISGKDLYDGEDGDSKRLEEFEKVLDNLDACESRYKEGIMPYAEKQIAENKQQIAENKQQIAENKQQIAENNKIIAENNKIIAENKQQIAENKQQIAENKQQIAENIKEIMRLDSIGIKNMISLNQKRDKLTQYETNKLKEDFKELLDDCKKREIDPIKILLAEVKAQYPNLKEEEARRKVDELLKYWK